MLAVQSFVNNPVTSNCFLLYDKENGKDCIIVDPGSRREDELFAFITKADLHPTHIILTHEHFDHCWGVNQLVAKYHIPIVSSELCAEAIKYEKRNCSVFYDNKEAFTIECETMSVEAFGMLMNFYDDSICFHHTPGHTEASISFVVGSYLFTGDTLIKDERTVTKLPTGSKERLKLSLDWLVGMQDKGYKVLPGHGECFELNGYDLQMMMSAKQNANMI